MHCNKWLVTQPLFSPMGPEKEVFHICRLPHIFHFGISVDISAAFIQHAGLVLMQSPGPGNKPMQSLTNRTDSYSVLAHHCWKHLLLTSLAQHHSGGRRLPFISPLQEVFSCRVSPEWDPPHPSILQSWGSRAWSCLPLAWSSFFSWQFSSSLASWSPCPHLKVRAHLRPLYLLKGSCNLMLLSSAFTCHDSLITECYKSFKLLDREVKCNIFKFHLSNSEERISSKTLKKEREILT